MKVLASVFHPNPSAFTINEAWVERLEDEPEVTVRKIYKLYPDGKIDVTAEQEVLLAHDRIVFQHSFYQYSTPSLTKQWFDQVPIYNWTYGSKGRALEGCE